MSKRKQLNIGLFGFGVVGEGIYQVINQTPSLNARITKVCIKHPEKSRNAPAELFTTDASLIFNDPEINVVVELIDHADEAFTIAVHAMKNGKSVVSANKKMIAEHLPELLELRDRYGVSFLYEAAVCGSIPVIRNLEEYYDNDLLHSFSGIVNGSTNYILTQMNQFGKSFQEALTEAQEKGFAESNPSLDIEGKDALNKLTIVLKHAYGLDENPERILCKGITRIHEQDLLFAKEKGFNIKLIAHAVHVESQKIAAFVLPCFISSENKLYSISNEYNGVLIGSKLADEQFLYGKGAGRFPTSSAVLSDVSALQYNYNYEYRKSGLGIQYGITDAVALKIFVSYPAGLHIDKADFLQVEELYVNNNRKYLIGRISIAGLKKAAWIDNPEFSVIGFDPKVAVSSVPDANLASVVLENTVNDLAV